MLLCWFSVICLWYRVYSIDNGLGISPPRGWRSWNAYGPQMNQNLAIKSIDILLDKSRLVNGNPTSLYELGYSHIGIDDGWEQCNSVGNYFHNDTAPNGWALIDLSKYTNLTSLIKYSHNRNVGIGWYFNNCGCTEHDPYPANELNDVKFLRMYDFDGIKLDSCGSSKNISNWSYLINITSNKPLLIENCGNSGISPTQQTCPMNFFRSSQDIITEFPNIIGLNLQSTIEYTNFSKPGCWAYPDMLQIGNIPQQYNASIIDMEQTHFSAWSIVSSPLILGFDMTNNKTMNRIWEIITNIEVLNMSDNWNGRIGTKVDESDVILNYNSTTAPGGIIKMCQWEIWCKPLLNNQYAVFVLNGDGNQSHDIIIQFKKIPWIGNANIRDIINHRNLGIFTDSFTAANVPPFGSRLLLFY